MATWQLFVDETGNFQSQGDALAVGGWLVEGYASAQLGVVLRNALTTIFAGTAYPVHAAHHNTSASLLFEPMRTNDFAPFPPRFVAAVKPAYDLLRSSLAPEALAFRATVEKAESVRAVPIAELNAVSRWLKRTAQAEWTRLREETDTQAGELGAFLEERLAPALVGRQAIVAAWKPTRQAPMATDPWGDADYWELFETMLERALALVAEPDGDANLWVHIAARTSGGAGTTRLAMAKANAATHPLLRRSKRATVVVALKEQHYNARAHPGLILADFMINRVRHALSGPQSWSNVEASLHRRVGLYAGSTCRLVRRATRLPAISGTAGDREAVRRASAGEVGPILGESPWARQQASIWVDAIREGL